MSNSHSWKAQLQGALMFQLHGSFTHFAIGIIKVREILPYQTPTVLPESHPYVIGVASIRGTNMPIIDLAAATGGRAVPESERTNQKFIVIDCMRMLVAFMVDNIDYIVDYAWNDVEIASKTLGRNVFITGTIRNDDKVVQLLDVERVLNQIYPVKLDQNQVALSVQETALLRKMKILIVDDSSVARKLTSEVLEQFKLSYQVCSDGMDALKVLKSDHPFHIIVSDIEMPGMDGYELAFNLKNDPETQSTYIILHTSLSSEISKDRAKQVGANEALSKFRANELLQAILRGAQYVMEASSEWEK